MVKSRAMIAAITEGKHPQRPRREIPLTAATYLPG